MRFKREFMGEFLGTFLLVLFGCGSVAVSVLFNAYNDFTAKTPIKSTFSGGKLSLYVELSSIG